MPAISGSGSGSAAFIPVTGLASRERHRRTARNAATAAALRRPCSWPARACAIGQCGSSGCLRNSASDSSSANRPRAVPRYAAISAAGPSPNDDGADGHNNNVVSQSSATCRLLTMRDVIGEVGDLEQALASGPT